MTICYDSKKHFDVILSITGTVWPNVMPLCLVNTFVTIVVYVLRELDVVDVTFDPAGHSTMSIMVGFLVVSRVCAAYNRFWEARTYVAKSLQQCKQLAVHAATFSKANNSNDANEWKRLLSSKLLYTINVMIDVIQDNEKTIDLVHNTTPMTKELLLKDPMDLFARLHGTIRMQKKILNPPMVIHKEMKLHQYIIDLAESYQGMTMFSATPYPFPIAQMTRIFLFMWVFTLPFALLYQSDELLSIILIIFFGTYGFFGLEFVSIEMDDPFGSDANDIEMIKLSSVAMRTISEHLGESSNPLLPSVNHVTKNIEHDEKSMKE
mmetsp:Transcript_2031/g.2718  ORF Transcript_2031/g.2718 Transcript_2031/m.2718 type:complete len:321 (+) Transcript_2031:174-1136(+)|eukprot:CAMPEP_0116062742 /NCGR_PEP_ID=MMETSP0322-20121206/7972_1 /TAXON_ID=163516 /ORGANISM="Leptocylindrus danicus var. apora, Strain B651" /LENGTH=320 /DNA_ID=CAMNT_0003548171 /DNA_START=156 /DNA_END=1118 /DNA_ORIENTATION=+